MCRIVAQFSLKPTNGLNPLVKDPYSLLRQSDAQSRGLQKDGWGLTWYSNGRPQSVHSTAPIFQEKARFQKVAREIHSSIFIAHIRAASNPLALPWERILRLENTQPFIRPPWTFAHNGTVYIVPELKTLLPGINSLLKGDNDSELLFLLLLYHWKRSFGSMSYAIRSMTETLFRLHPNPFSAINFLASDGERLYAYCQWNPKRNDREERRSLAFGAQPFFQMNYQIQKDKILVASEPTHREPGWQLLRQGELLVVDREDSKLRYQTQKIAN